MVELLLITKLQRSVFLCKDDFVGKQNHAEDYPEQAAI
jgi:hypothetical protein